MFQLRDQLFFAVSLLCCIVVQSAVTNRNYHMCVSSGVDSINANLSKIRTVTRVADFDALNMTDCPAGEKCYECSGQSNGIMLYSAICAAQVTDMGEMDCNDVGFEPCTSETDKKCHPVFTAITSLKKCRYVVTADLKIQDGGYEVYCNDTCITAVLVENDINNICKGCAADCIKWLDEWKLRNPQITTALCSEGEECPLASKFAADMASDDTSGGARSGEGACFRDVALALAVGVLVGIVGPSLAF